MISLLATGAVQKVHVKYVEYASARVAADVRRCIVQTSQSVWRLARVNAWELSLLSC